MLIFLAQLKALQRMRMHPAPFVATLALLLIDDLGLIGISTVCCHWLAQRFDPPSKLLCGDCHELQM